MQIVTIFVVIFSRNYIIAKALAEKSLFILFYVYQRH